MKKNERKRRGGPPLTLRERSIIEVRWCKDYRSVSEIAEELKRHKSSVSRELQGKARRGHGRYNADVLHRRACARIERRGNTPKTRRVPALKTYIEEKMELGWSPEQIHLRLPIDHRGSREMRIGTETVYQEVYRRVHRSGNGKVKEGETDLRPLLPRRHTRRAKKGFRKAQREERASVLPSIEKRPKTVNRRKRIGDWEDDTMVSRKGKARIKNATERKSGVTLFGKAKDGTAEACDRVLVEKLSRMPERARLTLTRDRGTENVRWEAVEKALGLRVFFAHPYSSHERGTNENTNGLIRRFFPKKTNWDEVSEDDLTRVEYLLNTRPRKRLGGKTPAEVFFKATGVALYSGM